MTKQKRETYRVENDLYIELTQGVVAVTDAKFQSEVENKSWHANYYSSRNKYYPNTKLNKKPVSLGRYVYQLEYGKVPSDLVIRYINGNPCDCRIDNLAVVRRSFPTKKVKRQIIDEGITARVELTKGQWAIVDADLLTSLNKHSWFAHWDRSPQKYYAKAVIRGKNISLHRLVYELVHGIVPEALVVDHINGDSLDNRVKNLRAVTIRQNCQNKDCHRGGKLQGVTFNKKHKMFYAQVEFNNTRYHLGCYDNEIEAHQAYVDAIQKFEQDGVLPTRYSDMKELPRGISYHKKHQRYQVDVTQNGKQRYQGSYKTLGKALEKLKQVNKKSYDEYMVKQV